MGLTKINKILKKYKELHKEHTDSWKDAQKRIRDKSPRYGVNETVYQQESYNHQLKGNKLFDAMMKELEGHEIFPKTKTTKNGNRKTQLEKGFKGSA